MLPRAVLNGWFRVTSAVVSVIPYPWIKAKPAVVQKLSRFAGKAAPPETKAQNLNPRRRWIARNRHHLVAIGWPRAPATSPAIPGKSVRIQLRNKSSTRGTAASTEMRSVCISRANRGACSRSSKCTSAISRDGTHNPMNWPNTWLNGNVCRMRSGCTRRKYRK